MAAPLGTFFPHNIAVAVQKTTWTGVASDTETTGQVFEGMHWIMRGMMDLSLLPNPFNSATQPTLTTAQQAQYCFWVKPPVWDNTNKAYTTPMDLKIWNPEASPPAWQDQTPTLFAAALYAQLPKSSGTNVQPI